MTGLEELEPSVEQSIAITSSMLDALGVEEALSAIVAEAELPMEIDDITTLTRLEAEGRVLRRVFTVDTDLLSLSAGVRQELTQTVCEDAWSSLVIEAGGTIEEVYLLPDGSELGRHSVTSDSCSI